MSFTASHLGVMTHLLPTISQKTLPIELWDQKLYSKSCADICDEMAKFVEYQKNKALQYLLVLLLLLGLPDFAFFVSF